MHKFNSQHYKYKIEKKHLAFHIGAETPNSGPQVCMLSLQSLIFKKKKKCITLNTKITLSWKKLTVPKEESCGVARDSTTKEA